MAKQFLANRSGQNPTLDEVPNETIKIYATEADLDADLANLEENEIVATDEDNNPASGTQYPVDVVQEDNMNAVTSNAVAESLSYSTTEQKTGGTWIDGKPIYRKVFIVNGYPATIQTGIPSTSEVINLICKNTTGGNTSYVFSGLQSNSNTYYPWVYELSADNSTLTRLTGTYSGTVKFIILEYTKED